MKEKKRISAIPGYTRREGFFKRGENFRLPE